MRHRKIRLSTIKNAVKHSSTLVANIGSGSVPSVHSIYFTDVGIRPSTGGPQNIKDIATTEGTINVGDIVKYVNICIQCGPRTAGVADNNGWLEWAVVRQEERTQLMGSTFLGTNTLMDTAQKQYRNNVFMTGCFPMGKEQPNSLDLKLKIPRAWEKVKMGGILIIFCYFRSVDSTDTRTDSHRLVVSSIFKCYS